MKQKLLAGLVVLAVQALVLGVNGAFADCLFQPTTDYATGASRSVAIGDLNADGIPDLVTANSGFNSVSVLLGTGDGTFGPRTDFAVGSGPVSVAIGDVNGDGKSDLATADYTNCIGCGDPDSSAVSVLLGNGNGTFGAPTDYPTGLFPTSVAIGDLNSDGNADVVTGNDSTDSLWVMLGRGDGTLGVRTGHATGGSPVSVAIRDLNGDEKPDLVTGKSNSVSVLLGAGDGTFGVRTDYATGGGYTPSVAVGDVNGDGALDLVTANYPNSVSVLLGTGDGAFRPRTDFAVGSPFTVAIGDVNWDGRQDVVTANYYAHTVSVFLGSGDGTFASKTDIAMGTGPVSAVIGDLNGDAKPDVVTANNAVNSVSVLLASPGFTLTATAAEGGSIFPPGEVTVPCGADKSFTIAADSCYAIAAVTVDGVNQGNVATYTFTNVTTNHTIHVDFALVCQHSLIVTSLEAEGGVVTSAPPGISCEAACAASFTVGSVVTLTATPRAGWIFMGWSGDATGDDSTTTVTMDGDKAIVARFLTVVFPTVQLVYPNGGEILVVGSEYKFTWYAADSLGVAGVDLDLSRDNGATYESIARDIPNTGTFVWRLTGPEANTSATPVFAGRFRVTARNAEGFSASDESDGPFAIYDLNPHHTVTVGLQGRGVVSRSPDLAFYDHGSTVMLTALPDSGWRFVGWSGDTADTSASLQLVVDRNLSVVATFRDAIPPAVSVIYPNGGEILVVGSQYKLAWSASDPGGVVAVDLSVSRDSGATWQPIATGQTSAGTYVWLVGGHGNNSAASPVFASLLRVTAHDSSGNVGSDQSDAPFAIHDLSPPLSVGAASASYGLGSVAPNPTAGASLISYSLPEDAVIHLSIYDLQGREVAVVADGLKAAGSHRATWTPAAADDHAKAGVYFVRYRTPRKIMVQRIVVAR